MPENEYFNHLAYTFALLVRHERDESVGEGLSVKDQAMAAVMDTQSWRDYPIVVDRAYQALYFRFDAARQGAELSAAREELIELIGRLYLSTFDS